jgi:hypothetical protein
MIEKESLLEVAISGYLDTSFKELPIKLQERINWAFAYDWDDITPLQRAGFAKQSDEVFSHEGQKEWERITSQVYRGSNIDDEIAEIETLPVNSFDEGERKKEKIKGLRCEQEKINSAVVSGGASKAEWKIIEPKRYQGYRKPLYELIKKAHENGDPIPSVDYILSTWRKNLPDKIKNIRKDGVDVYSQGKRTTSFSSIKAITQCIQRMTKITRQ